MKHLKEMKLFNIQGHKYSVIEFPKTGIVQITGDNSNGKSSLTRVLDDIIKCQLHNRGVRLSLIHFFDEVTDAQFVLQFYDNTELHVNIDTEVSKTYYKYTNEIGEETLAHASNRDACMDLIRSIGFDPLLHICDADRPKPFQTTTGSENYQILSTCITDISADKTIEVAEQYLEKFQGYSKHYTEQVSTLKMSRSKLVLYDEELSRNLVEKLKVLRSIYEYESYEVSKLSKIIISEPYPLDNLSNLEFPQARLNTISFVQPHDMVDVDFDFEWYVLSGLNLTFSHVLPKVPDLSDCTFDSMDSTLTDLELLRSQICPTCGRGFIL